MKSQNLAIILSLVTVLPVFSEPKVSSSEENIRKFEEAILQEIVRTTEVKATILKDENLSKCFEGVFSYAGIRYGDDGVTHPTTWAQTAGVVRKITEPGSDAEITSLTEVINPAFRLKTDADGEVMMAAFKVLFSSRFKDDFEPRVVQKESGWEFVTGAFLRNSQDSWWKSMPRGSQLVSCAVFPSPSEG